MPLRLFVSNRLVKTESIILNEAQTHYLVHVMRIQKKDVVYVFNGLDGEWKTAVEEISKKYVVLSLIEQIKKQDKLPDVWLCFSPVKKDHTDLIVQKATELGVGYLCPIITKRTIAKNINLDRMVAVATEASEQCERLTIPTILSPQKFDDLLKNWDNTRNLYYLSERDNTAIMPVFSERVAFLVGPEGGFAPEEIKKLNNFPVAYPINLGKRILRAETACIASMVIWNQCVGW